MPLIQMKEVFSPLKLFGIKLFFSISDGNYYIKVRNKHRRKLNSERSDHNQAS
ncbi:hypothetical protein [Radiobacillus sp. PE A8.2]|uniref:hypothetical protein n=1 Tax=Radiobacillus sp. PE A8.2 TaxID=3380349 RepID=UPI00388DDD7F